MRNLPTSRLRLNAYWLESLRYEVNGAFEPVGEIQEVPIRFSAECAPDQDTGSFTVRVHIRSRRRRAGNVPHTFEASLAGSFSFPGNGTELSESDERLLRFNAPAILYGIARGLLFAATAPAVYGPVMLPSGNLVAVLSEDE